VCFLLARDLGEHVRLTKHEEILSLDLDLGAAVLRIQDLVAFGDVERDALVAILVPLPLTDREDLAALRLLLGRVGEDDAARGGLPSSIAFTMRRSPRGLRFMRSTS
jgi:hypothetical protein